MFRSPYPHRIQTVSLTGLHEEAGEGVHFYFCASHVFLLGFFFMGSVIVLICFYFLSMMFPAICLSCLWNPTGVSIHKLRKFFIHHLVSVFVITLATECLPLTFIISFAFSIHSNTSLSSYLLLDLSRLVSSSHLSQENTYILKQNTITGINEVLLTCSRWLLPWAICRR